MNNQHPFGFDGLVRKVQFEDDLLDLHEQDMVGAIEDPEQVPKAPNGVEEPVTDETGTKMVDMERDGDRIDLFIVSEEVGMGSPVIDVDIAEFTELEPDI